MRSPNALRVAKTSPTRSGARCRTDGSPRRVQRSSERSAEARVRPSLTFQVPHPRVQRLRSERVEQLRLADLAQPGQHQAALRPPPLYPLQRDVERGQLGVAAGFSVDAGRLQARTGSGPGPCLGPYQRV